MTTAATIDSNVIQVATDDCRHGRWIGVDLKVAGTLRVPWQRAAADRVCHRSLGGRHGGACLLLMHLCSYDRCFLHLPGCNFPTSHKVCSSWPQGRLGDAQGWGHNDILTRRLAQLLRFDQTRKVRLRLRHAAIIQQFVNIPLAILATMQLHVLQLHEFRQMHPHLQIAPAEPLTNIASGEADRITRDAGFGGSVADVP